MPSILWYALHTIAGHGWHQAAHKSILNEPPLLYQGLRCSQASVENRYRSAGAQLTFQGSADRDRMLTGFCDRLPDEFFPPEIPAAMENRDEVPQSIPAAEACALLCVLCLVVLWGPVRPMREFPEKSPQPRKWKRQPSIMPSGSGR